MADKISITICGDGGCGKSSITLRLVRSQWIHEYDPTIEDSYSVTRTVDGLPYFLSITDTAGQEEYRGLWTASTLQSDAFLLVYDITNPASLQTLDYFLETIREEAQQRAETNERLRKNQNHQNPHEIGLPPPVTIVAGNKCDLKEGRVVTARDGLEYARKHGCGFMETSAREMVNIEETFALLVRRVIEARRQHYQQAVSAPARPSTERPGPSTHTTALPPTMADASALVSSQRRSRWRRVLGFGTRQWRQTESARHAEDEKTVLNTVAEKQLEEQSERASFCRRLCCVG